MSFYGIQALRRVREQQEADPNPPMDDVKARYGADDETLETSSIETEIGDEDDDFEALYEAWIDFGMESGG